LNNFDIVSNAREGFRFNDISIKIDESSSALLLEGSYDVVKQVKEKVKSSLRVNLNFIKIFVNVLL